MRITSSFRKCRCCLLVTVFGSRIGAVAHNWFQTINFVAACATPWGSLKALEFNFGLQGRLKSPWKKHLLVLYSAPRGFLQILRFSPLLKNLICINCWFQFTVLPISPSLPFLSFFGGKLLKNSLNFCLGENCWDCIMLNKRHLKKLAQIWLLGKG